MSFFLLHSQSAPPSHSLSPCVPPSPTHLWPPSLPPLSPHLQCKYTSLPCWTSNEKVSGWCAPPHLLFHHQRSSSAFAVCWLPPVSFHRAAFLPVWLTLLFLLQPHARGRLKRCKGKKRKKSAAISTVRASPQPALHRRSFFHSLLAGF